MITLETANQAISVTQELDSRSVFLKAQSGTPLDKLTALSNIAPEVNASIEYNPIAQEIVDLSFQADDVHSFELQAFSEQISTAVQKHLNFAKSVVRPAIESVANQLQKTYSDLEQDKQFNLDIVVIDPVAPMVQANFQEMVNAYNDLPYLAFNETLPLVYDETMTSVNFAAMCKTGDSNIDHAIDEMLISCGDSVFMQTYKALHSQGNLDIHSLMNEPFEGDKIATLVFLFTNKLFDNPPENTGRTLISYNETIDNLRKAAAFRLNRAYDYHETNNTNKFLVLKNTNKQVFVNGTVYREWLEQGGNNAIVLGNAISANPKLLLSDILDSQATLLQAWERQNVLINSASRSNSYITKKDALRNALLDYSTNNFDACFAHLLPEGVTGGVDMVEYKTYIKLLDTFVDNLKDSDLLNIWSISTKAVCECLFYYTDAKKILEGIDSAILTNPGIDLREALLLSTIEYVVDYTCNQIEYA